MTPPPTAEVVATLPAELATLAGATVVVELFVYVVLLPHLVCVLVFLAV